MTKITKEYFCDICGEKFDGQFEVVKFSCSGKDYSGAYVGGFTFEKTEVCNKCTYKIREFVDTIRKDKQ